MNDLGAILVGLLVGALSILVLQWKRGAFKRSPEVLNSADVVAEGVARMVIEQFGDRLEKLHDVEALTEQKLELRTEVAMLGAEVETLVRQKDDITADFTRKQRELQHAAGLLRKELDAELTRVRSEVNHEAETRILAKEREFNARQMEFTEERFKGELETLNGLVETLTERLPDVSARLRLKGDV